MRIDELKMNTPARFFTLALLMAISMSLSACNKNAEDTPEPTPQISEEEAAAVVEGAVTARTQGLGAELEDAIYLADEYAEKSGNGGPCGEPFDSTLTRSIDTANLTASYTVNWSWLVNCNTLNIPTAIDYQRAATGSYETARMSSSDSANSNWSISSLIQGPNYVLDGTYTRQGSQQSRVRNQNSFSSTLLIEVDNLNIDKGTRRIQSGIAGFTLTITGPGNNTQTIEGDIVFNGNGSATIIINGNSYNVNLY
ncbi:MAG: hypothetical protein KDD19_19140 [Phaeodactylibacter sp.]|nr:hypothetical protein [Phaeodactylibacter sp.]MCB9052059.1 hypothetical protein [Lewinellaceae bacterium]